jgi:hypothetical protein
MFDNIGSKIKGLAQIVCWIGIIVSVIFGFALMDEVGFGGIVAIILGSLFSWVGSFCLYGFGELIEKTTEIAKNTRCSNTNHEDISNNNPKTQKCPHCGARYNIDDPQCPDCGYQRRIIKQGEYN